ncbi:helix-turn-helix domain-containing protein [Azospirillum sp. SYSU D00513]|uniref:IclR family transcriptional regulator n=1 Tax=Azospirillum sp. SYSU D00513 TaxID=2812561 RepID=UPI0020003E14|nr:helix-turn-helix domain-containing protein [Azospirillum sp. SYSU D00513]
MAVDREAGNRTTASRADAGRMGAKPVNALVRGLRVLAAANERSVATVSDLVTLSRLPKATVIRLLQTLLHEGYVEELGDGGGYRVTAKVRNLSRALRGRTPVAQIVQPLLDRLGGRVKWPSEFFLVEGHSVVIEASNRDAAPVKVNLFEHRRFPIAASATGLAYLSGLEPGEAERLLRAAMDKDAGGEAVAERIARVAEARRRGYALWEYPALAPGLRMASIPVRAGGQAIGGLSLIHFRDIVPDDLLEGFFLAEMRAVAEEIGRLLEREMAVPEPERDRSARSKSMTL